MGGVEAFSGYGLLEIASYMSLSGTLTTFFARLLCYKHVNFVQPSANTSHCTRHDSESKYVIHRSCGTQQERVSMYKIVPVP